MANWRDDDVIRVLSCEIDARPTAPGPDELAPFVKSAALGGESLTLELDDAAVDVATAFVAAEQVCCAGIGWELQRSPELRLRITASAPQLNVLAGLVPKNIVIEEVQ